MISVKIHVKNSIKNPYKDSTHFCFKYFYLYNMDRNPYFLDSNKNINIFFCKLCRVGGGFI